ncbi:hypothetical protein AX17_007027 [Amanita inopinata Kibby_2008]|nr:hypothetical protein AX17_007027 [Amanita inopinata Kibby_2008]
MFQFPNSHPNSKSPVLFNYLDAVRVFNDKNVQGDMTDACERLAKATASLMSKFDSIATRLHTLDIQRQTSTPLCPNWNSIRHDFRRLVWQTRTNAGFIAGRLKIFSTAVLPVAAQDLNGPPSQRLNTEKLQVVSSYMNISTDNANLTHSLVSKGLQFGSTLNGFHADVAKVASNKAPAGQKELRDVIQKLSDLDQAVQQVCTANGRLVMPDVSHFVFSAFRVITATVRRPSRSKICHQKVRLGSDLSIIGNLHDQLDRTRNEAAHAQYVAQTAPARDTIITSVQMDIFSLVSDALLTNELIFGFFLATWSRLLCDCTEILHWLKGSSKKASQGQTGTPPMCISVYVEDGKTLYAGIANALNAFVSALEPSWFTQLNDK